MNTNKLKAYAPKARTAFMDAVEKKAATLGLYADRIADISTDGDNAVIEGRIFTRKQGQQRNQLVRRINELGTTNGKLDLALGFKQFINETAFTWFNRLTAIRYMEVNDYLDHGYRVLSKGENALFGEGFEILGAAADIADDLGLNKDQIIDMVLDGGKEEELYRTILLGQCHQLSEAMPFMFEKLDDATELLLPDNLTKTDSILKDLINEVPEDNWAEIEVIGWLYQFYISEHKDAVIGKVVKTEDIPAATQLFTPNWIVKYMVHNSLGRKWLGTYPNSELKNKMEYYITPAEQSEAVIEQLKAITPKSIDPETIKVLDPACGSGHILVEVYDVLREIYLELDYRPREIPELILTKNIFALDIDDRAVQLASFALLMKAREDDKRIFSRKVELNIHSIQSTENLDINQIWKDLNLDGKSLIGSTGDLFAEDQITLEEPSQKNKVFFDLLHYIRNQFNDAKNLGSLVEIDHCHLETLCDFQDILIKKAISFEPNEKQISNRLLPIIEQAITLANRYDIIVENPPYMGSKAMNKELKSLITDNLTEGKSDLMTAFVLRGSKHLKPGGFLGSVTLDSWLFLSSYTQLRSTLRDNISFDHFLHIGWNCFPDGHVYNRGVASIIRNIKLDNNFNTSMLDLSDVPATVDKKELFFTRKEGGHGNYINRMSDFLKIPDCPFSFSLDRNLLDAYESGTQISKLGKVVKGLDTCDNDRFTRLWYEVSQSNSNYDVTSNESLENIDEKWFPYCKGGSYRKWYGNYEYVVNWKNDGYELRNFRDEATGKLKSRPQSMQHYFQNGLTFGAVTSSDFSCRYMEKSIFGGGGNAIFVSDPLYLVGFLNSDVFRKYMDALNPTINMLVGDILKIPLINSAVEKNDVINNVQELISLQESNWNTSELSWSFKAPEILDKPTNKIKDDYQGVIESRHIYIEKLNELERLNNEYFERIYNCSKYNKKEKFNTPSFRDVFSDLISYSVGIIVGRYSLDNLGLMYANSSNNGFNELVQKEVYKTFPVDDDGIVPLADEDWVFEDDATTRFREFVKTVWGEEHLQENLDFIAESLCLDAIKAKKNESSMDTIRRYFSTQFFKDHVKTYKKRPIYWLFSSGKAKAFECLVYLHRYNEGTLSRMRTEYVTPLMGKLESRKGILEDSKPTASGAELRAIDKELKTIEKKQAELVTFDEELKHLSEMKISLDLDDGVKENYGKFGNLLADAKAIHGKKPAEIK